MAISLAPIWGGNPIFQRSANGAVYPFVLGWTDKPGAVQGRIRRADGSVYIDWFQLTGNFGGGAWSGVPGFPAQPGWLILDVRSSGDPGTIASSGYFGTGDVYVIGGQSLAELLIGNYGGLGTRNYPASYYIPDKPEAAALGNGAAGWGTALGPAATAMTNALSAASGVATGFIFLARGGTPLCKASAPGNAPAQYLLSQEGSLPFPQGNFMTGAVKAVSDCGSGGFAGILFIGNEQDAISTSAIDLYLGLNQYLFMIGAASALPKKIIMGMVGKFGDNVAGTTLVRQTQVTWAQNTPGAQIGASRYDLPRTNSDGWNVHPTVAGALRLGQRHAMDLLNMLNPTTYPRSAEGPKVTLVTRSTNVVTVSISLNGSAGIAAQNSGANLTGFTVSSDNGVTLLPASTATLSGTKVTLTLASTPVAPISVNYQATSATATPSDNLIYTTDVVPGDTLGLPLRCMAGPMAEFISS